MAKNKGLSFIRKERVNSGIFKEIFSWIFGIGVSIFVAFALVFLLGMRTTVVGDSMEPTLYNGQEILVDKFRYLIVSPKKGDVVVFFPNGNENAHYYVKRVVAVQGDNVLIKDGTLYVNGKASSLYTANISDPGIASNEITLSSGEFFCLGDDPDNSEDSRSANVGAVNKDFIVGRAWYCLPYAEAKNGFID